MDGAIRDAVNALSGCPLQEYDASVLLAAGIDPAAKVQICQTSDDVQNTTFAIVAISALPARLEPTYIGEGVIGIVLQAGKVVALVVVTAQLAQYGTSLWELNNQQQLVASTSAGTLTLPRYWDRSRPEQVPEEALENYAKHALAKHWAYLCIMFAARNALPDEVYFSKGAHHKEMFTPSTIFLWDAEKVVRGVGKDFARCAMLSNPSELRREFPGDNTVMPVLSDLYLALVVAYDEGLGIWYTRSGYLVEKQFKLTTLCSWGYKEQLYPVIAPVPCNNGY
uniref:Uncharacterized protein n=1 Tax=candidate division WWE3 bacterium TaxID=2053526 RepID=A0A7C4TRV8_UNCKA